MDKELLFRFSCDEKGEPFTLDFHETAEGVVTASYQKRDGGMVFADVEIVDLSGRKTHVPAKVRTLLQIKDLQGKIEAEFCLRQSLQIMIYTAD